MMTRPKVNEFSSDLSEKNVNIDMSVSNIVKCVKIAMGEFTGIADLFNNLDGTISIVCQDSDVVNNFSKLEMSPDGKSLLGVMLVGKTKKTKKGWFIFKYSWYSTNFHFRLFSIVADNEEQIKQIHNNFNERFNSISHKLKNELQNHDRRVKLALNCCSTSSVSSSSLDGDEYDKCTFIPENRPKKIAKVENTNLSNLTFEDKYLVDKMINKSNHLSYDMYIETK